MKTDSLTSQLKEHALSQGIDLIGITSARPFVRQGKEQEIIDPKALLPDAQAVIVTAFHMNEAISGFPMDKDPPRGRYSLVTMRNESSACICSRMAFCSWTLGNKKSFSNGFLSDIAQ
jgi:hypothetical protein